MDRKEGRRGEKRIRDMDRKGGGRGEKERKRDRGKVWIHFIVSQSQN